MQNGLKYGVSLQCLLSSWSKTFNLRTLTKFQSLNSLLTVNKRYIQLLLLWFHFLDLLIKFMKVMLLYILYCSPTPATCADLPVLPPPLRPISGEGEVGPSRGHVFGWRGERGETGVTPPHAEWQRTQKILVLFVMLIPQCRTAKDRIILAFFIMSKSKRKAYFMSQKLGS
jgi:hypothetical protein